MWIRWTRPSAVRVVVGGCGASINKTFTTGLRPWENKPTAPAARWKCTPIPAARDFHLKVKRLTTFCASLALLQSVFPYKRIHRRLFA